VDEAFAQWRARKAAEGHFIDDAWERRDREMRKVGRRTLAEQAWLKEWTSRHLALCVLAGISDGTAEPRDGATTAEF
jgi:hypothetical protein